MIADNERAFFTAALGAVAFALRWLFGREVGRLDRQLADHEARLRFLERELVTKADIDKLAARIGDVDKANVKRMQELADRNEERHIELLEALNR